MWASTRIGIMFAVGCLLSVAIHLLHVEHNVVTSRHRATASRGVVPDYGLSLWDVPWWVPIICGLSSVLIGELYPLIDSAVGAEPTRVSKRDR